MLLSDTGFKYFERLAMSGRKYSCERKIVASLRAQAFAPMAPYGLALVQRMAAQFGLRSGAQGSGRKRFVVVSATPRSGMPDAASRQRLHELLAAHEAGVAALGPVASGAAPAWHTGGGGGGGSGGGAGPRSARRAAGGAAKRLNEPVGFVASGVLEPCQSPAAVIQPPLALAHAIAALPALPARIAAVPEPVDVCMVGLPPPPASLGAGLEAAGSGLGAEAVLPAAAELGFAAAAPPPSLASELGAHPVLELCFRAVLPWQVTASITLRCLVTSACRRLQPG